MKSTENMVLLRASQINGCGFCTDIHANSRSFRYVGVC
jgi:AhpD family alkylhydroperoxidase